VPESGCGFFVLEAVMERTTPKRLLTGYLLIFLVLICIMPVLGVVAFGLFFVPIFAIAVVAEAIRLVRSAFTSE